MKIVNILGGLGNQMFQYAFALSLKYQFPNEVIKINTQCFNGYPLHNGFEIDNVFHNSSIEKASIGELSSLAYPYCNYRLWQIGSRLLPKRRSMIVESPTAILDTSILKKKGNFFYDGYWQEEEYFSVFREKILTAFEFPQLEDEKNNNLAKFISENDSVSIHIRRGDYVQHPFFKDICTEEYYKNAIRMIMELDPYISAFIIFSNDPEWTKLNFGKDFGDKKLIFVDWNKGSDSFYDMHLMSLCKHNIIANSSFSWWGAWLNINRDKIVLAPHKWINGKSQQKTICESWIKVK